MCVLAVEFIDIHSHILPGVDDGCEDMIRSLTILKEMQNTGVTDVFLTPHYCKRRGYVTPVDKVRDVYDQLCKAVQQENISVNLHLGTEMEYSQDGSRYIKEGRVNTLGDTKYLLVEFPPYVSPKTFFSWIREICSLGYVPVVAHIERYTKVTKDKLCIESIRQLGALIQVNLRSVCSFNLRQRKFIKWLICNRYVDFIAGDVHEFPIEEKEFQKCSRLVVRCSDEEYLRKIMSENARKILLRQG